MYVIIAGLDAGLHSPWCGAGAGLNIEVCGAVRAPALDDGAVRCGPLHCGAVRSRAKLLGPRRALQHRHSILLFYESINEYIVIYMTNTQYFFSTKA